MLKTKLFKIALLTAFFSLQAEAGTFVGSFGVLASVNNNCAIATTDRVGSYDPTSPTDFLLSGTSTIVCTLGTNFHVRVNKGLHGSSVTNRQLSDGVHTINYFVYRDPARTLNWGETDGVDTVDGVGTGGVQTVTSYSRVPALQNVPPGIYTDTLTVTVSF